STVIQVADSVTAQLNSASLSKPFTAKRLYVPNFALEDLAELTVSVAPRDIVLSALDRLTNRCNVRVDIAVLQKFKSGTNAEIDPLLNLIEEITDVFRLKRLDSLPAARCITIEHPVIYSVEHWEQFRQFTSLLTLTFQLAR